MSDLRRNESMKKRMKLIFYSFFFCRYRMVSFLDSGIFCSFYSNRVELSNYLSCLNISTGCPWIESVSPSHSCFYQSLFSFSLAPYPYLCLVSHLRPQFRSFYHQSMCNYPLLSLAYNPHSFLTFHLLDHFPPILPFFPLR